MARLFSLLIIAWLLGLPQLALVKEPGPNPSSQASILPKPLGDVGAAPLCAWQPAETDDQRDDAQDDDAHAANVSAAVAVQLSPLAPIEEVARPGGAVAVMLSTRAIQECGPPCALARC